MKLAVCKPVQLSAHHLLVETASLSVAEELGRVGRFVDANLPP
ncbi:MAG: hypothetical protein U0R49_07720 [Fimbriimonadales bacterium]